jgi:CheY-like chemotaxis protein
MSACGVRQAHSRDTTPVFNGTTGRGPLRLATARQPFPYPRESGGSVCGYRKKEPVRAARPIVSIVDDDESVCQSLPDLLRELGFSAQAFSSAEEFLTSDRVNRTKCLLLDVAMPGMSGPELQRELKLRGLEIPIIFITGQTDPALCHRLLEQGAVACLLKPFNESALVEALKSALRSS